MYKTNKKNIIFILLLITNIAIVNSQILVITLKDNSIKTYNITNVISIKFELNSLILNEVDGTITNLDISKINKYSFDIPTKTNEVYSSKLVNFKIFPSPASDIVNIEYFTEDHSEVKIEIIDLKGSVVATIFEGIQSGKQNYQWQTQNLHGFYLCRIISKNDLVTKPIIVN